MSAVEKDFDRLALLDSDGWTHNNHYHRFLLRQIPENCDVAMEIGCGTGAFARCLGQCARRVVAVDLSSEMIRVARARSPDKSNIEFRLADITSQDLPSEHFDCIAIIATLHHLPLRDMLLNMKAALKPGGVLLVLDLFEPSDVTTPEGVLDFVLNVVAMGASAILRIIHNGRLLPAREVRAAWAEHGKSDSYLTMSEVRDVCADILPVARIRKHLFWRYSITWQKLPDGPLSD